MGDPGATLTPTPDPKAMQHNSYLLYPAAFLTPHVTVGMRLELPGGKNLPSEGL